MSSTSGGSATYSCSPHRLGTCPLPHPPEPLSVHEGRRSPENPAPRAGPIREDTWSVCAERSRTRHLAAIVAYEHHIMLDGGGYPALHDARGAQYASRLVHICDVYDGLRTNRPYRRRGNRSERSLTSRAGPGMEF